MIIRYCSLSADVQYKSDRDCFGGGSLIVYRYKEKWLNRE